MTTYFSIVQYVPDQVADDRMNFGVVAFSETDLRVRFARNRKRIEAFGGEDSTFLFDFASRLTEAADRKLRLFQTEEQMLGVDALRSMIGGWQNSIQFTPLRTSLLSPAEVIGEIAPKYLRDRVSRRRAFRDRRTARALAVRVVRRELDVVMGPQSAGYFSKNARVKGKLDEHTLDAVVRDGELYFAAQGLSFEGPPRRDLTRDLDSTAWAIDDIRAKTPEALLAVLTLPPRSSSKTYDNARRVFEGLGARVIVEGKHEPEVHEALVSVLPGSARMLEVGESRQRVRRRLPPSEA